MIVLSAVGMASAFMTGLQHDIDGLLLISVSVLMGSLFSFAFVALIKQQGWLANLSLLCSRRPVLPHFRDLGGGRAVRSLKHS
jgi:hypothetical protein